MIVPFQLENEGQKNGDGDEAHRADDADGCKGQNENRYDTCSHNNESLSQTADASNGKVIEKQVERIDHQTDVDGIDNEIQKSAHVSFSTNLA